MENFFQFKKYGTNIGTEVVAGITTFVTMAYIIAVNPQILSLTGMDFNAVVVATIICSVIGTLFMGLFANVPYALAPGMGLNAFFTFTVCFAMGFTWQQGLGLVLITGVVNLIITLSGMRKKIISAMPTTLRAAISGGIGMFLAYIGIKDGGLLKFTADAPFLAVLSNAPGAPVTSADTVGTVVASSAAVPAFVNFGNLSVILTLLGLIIIIILLVKKVTGAIIIGILAITVINVIIQLINGNPPDLSYDLGATVSSIQHTFLHLDLGGLLIDPKTNGFDIARLMLAITAAIGFCLTDIFDCIGTLIGTGRKTGIFDEEDEKLFSGHNQGLKSRLDRAFFADLTATITGSIFGTSNTTTYVESAAGIAAGGRTGFTSVVTAIMFALCIFIAPLLRLIPASATAPALIVVGAMMMSAFADIKWGDFDVAVPAFLCSVIMPLSYGITNGIAWGFISYAIVHVTKGKGKEVSAILYVVSVLFILNFVLQAVYHL